MVLAGIEVDNADVSDVSIEWPAGSMPLSLFTVEDVNVAGVNVSNGLGSVTTVPFKKDTLRVEVEVMVVVLSEVVDMAEELKPGVTDMVGEIDVVKLVVSPDGSGDIFVCESDIVALGRLVLGAVVWAETVSTPMEVKETTVASVPSTTVLAMVVLPF